MDFFADNIYNKCYREVVDDMMNKDYWITNKRFEDISYWKLLTKKLLKNISTAQLLDAFDECICETSETQTKERWFSKAQTSYKISISRQRNPGKRGKFRKIIDERLKITDVAKKYGLEVKKRKTLCPFHADGHPSLSFNDDKNVFHCFGCSAKGDIVEFVRRMEEIPRCELKAELEMRDLDKQYKEMIKND